MNKQIEMNQLLRYRSVWLGIAMIWICLFHSGFQVSSVILNYIKMSGFGGVDICLFASGIGCYFSLTKDAKLLRFWQRRFLRLAPTYLCFITVWLIYKIAVFKWPLRIVIGNLLGIQSFIEYEYGFNWYISALLLFYLLSPLLKRVSDNVNGSLARICWIFLILLFSVLFWDTDRNVIFTRLPIFCLGMLFAKDCIHGEKLDIKKLIYSFVAVITGLLIYHGVNSNFSGEIVWSYGLQWYPFLLIVPGSCIYISLLCLWLEKRKKGKKIIQWLECVGRYSFEIYLIHIPLFEILSPLFETLKWQIAVNGLWFGLIPVIAIGCILLKKITETGMQRLTRIIKHKM